MSSIGAFWQCGDRNRTNFNKIYGTFEEIGLLLVGHDFQWLEQFGLDVLLGIDVNLYLTLFFLYESSIKIVLAFYGKKDIPSNFLIDQNYHSSF